MQAMQRWVLYKNIRAVGEVECLVFGFARIASLIDFAAHIIYVKYKQKRREERTGEEEKKRRGEVGRRGQTYIDKQCQQWEE